MGKKNVMGTPKRRLIRDLKQVLSAYGAQLVTWEVRRGADTLLRVFIDHPRGVDLELCRCVTLRLQESLTWLESYLGPLRFEVSSPGIERELRKPREFFWAVGRPVRVLVRPEPGSPAFLRGRLAAVSRSGIRLAADHAPEVLFIPWAKIAKVRLDPRPI